ncbi:MAG TPA: DNA alkylation repair protein [Opitutaceae bacterium]|jgi:3-methyladenine DNA glycosylase AlkD
MTAVRGPKAGLAAEIMARIAALGSPATPALRVLRRSFSQRLASAPRRRILDLAGTLARAGYPSVGFELVRFHPEALGLLTAREVEALGRGLDSWGAVDCFGVLVAGPAWRRGRLTDNRIHRWARSPDRWRRRAALVSTVALNSAADAGLVDARRTLAVCRRLAGDRDPLVVKALSWALRQLAKRDPGAVRAYLAADGDLLAAQVRREVRNKLETGRKQPRRP